LIDRIKTTVSPYAHPEQRASDASPIEPAAVIRVINDLIPPGSHIAVDAGNCVGWALHYLEIDYPTRAHISLAMGAMGFGVGAVLGAKFAAPQTTCVGIVGDGAFLMHGAEVSTAARYRAGAIWVVLSDNELMMVNQGMNYFYPDPAWKDYYQLGEPDLVKFAESLGANAYGVHSPAELAKALGEAMARADSAKQPQVIVAYINKDSMPPYYKPKSS
jgi:acetolactate synthase I/II/III large subunit